VVLNLNRKGQFSERRGTKMNALGAKFGATQNTFQNGKRNRKDLVRGGRACVHAFATHIGSEPR